MRLIAWNCVVVEELIPRRAGTPRHLHPGDTRRGSAARIGAHRPTPYPGTVFVDRTHAVERNTNDHPIVATNRKAAPRRVQHDGRERDNLFLASNAIVVTQRERPLAELCIPLDAVEKLAKRLHAIKRRQIGVEPVRDRWASRLSPAILKACACDASAMSRRSTLPLIVPSANVPLASRLPAGVPVRISTP